MFNIFCCVGFDSLFSFSKHQKSPQKSASFLSLDDIIDVIQSSVDVIDIMKPVYNFKASDELPLKKK
ncbi:MAG TPA: hypothetical protein DD430_07745 [Ruminococcus sp.]|nr:hypothetical protein [Ruminococcus sp.]HCV91545.1 hypothetical protein [Ruminococcus sp.]